MALFWTIFHLFLLGCLGIDLWFYPNKQVRSFRKTVFFCSFWVLLTLIFAAYITMVRGKEDSALFLYAYLLEMMLSVDNLLVIAAIFAFLQIQPLYQHRVLFWGIIGAVFFRMGCVVAGVSLLHAFSWMPFALGVLLCISAFLLYQNHSSPKQFSSMPLVRLCSTILPMHSDHHQGRFFIRHRATSLFSAIVLVEGVDVLFALDSIPAVLSITSDFFLAYTSNIFAILGLRSFYFLVVSIQKKLSFFQPATIAILFFIGVKMLLSPWFSIGMVGSVIGLLVILGSFALIAKRR